LNKCPRCEANLISGKNDHFCPNYHGALLTLKEFREETNQGFAKKFFASWLRMGNRRTITCPMCNTKMVQLTVEEKTTFELDCCPICFSLWLDRGEDNLLRDLFLKHLAAEKVSDLSSDQHQILGKLIVQQDRVVSRYRFLERWGRILNRKVHYYERWRHRGFLFFDNEEVKKR
jgi:Zn-finger nucleic acid-binding protein